MEATQWPSWLNGELGLPDYNLVLAVGSEPRLVPGPSALDARQNAPRPLRVRVPSDRLVRLRYPCEARGETMKTDNLHVVHARAAGLDIHKMQITASVRICLPDGGEPLVETRTFEALPGGIGEMVAWLLEHEDAAGDLRGAARRHALPRSGSGLRSPDGEPERSALDPDAAPARLS